MGKKTKVVKVLRDGEGNPIRMIKITIDKTGKVWYNGGTPKERK
jgi:hypothetical protein